MRKNIEILKETNNKWIAYCSGTWLLHTKRTCQACRYGNYRRWTRDNSKRCDLIWQLQKMDKRQFQKVWFQNYETKWIVKWGMWAILGQSSRMQFSIFIKTWDDVSHLTMKWNSNANEFGVVQVRWDW